MAFYFGTVFDRAADVNRVAGGAIYKAFIPDIGEAVASPVLGCALLKAENGKLKVTHYASCKKTLEGGGGEVLSW
ncbi:MAG: hypothetical protein FJ222_05700 [Lentisphaerae bacterium]|nr:hypothetical protein [Lentisphaerota bacterium]